MPILNSFENAEVLDAALLEFDAEAVRQALINCIPLSRAEVQRRIELELRRRAVELGLEIE